MTPGRIAIFVDRVDWHATRLSTAFAARGMAAAFVPMRDCGFETGRGEGLALPGFEDGLPDAAIVRFVPAGTFEEVTLRLSVLHALRNCGVAVWNDARAIERCIDKGMTSFLLHRAGLPTPPAWVCESAGNAASIVEREASADVPLVLKPLFGSQGRGLKLVHKAADLPADEEVDGVYYLQRYVVTAGPGWRDMRVFVVGGRAIAAMTRHGKGWITNAKQGAACEALALDDRLAGLAVAAAQAVGAGYAGVDIMRDRDGRDFVLEVNSMPAWSALQRATGVNVAQALADGFIVHLDPGRPVVALSGAAGG